MNVLIKDMEMLQRCMGCTLCYVGHMYDLMCGVLRRPINVEDETGRDRFCSLVEVPTPHGRLIDIKSVEDGKFHAVGNDCQRWWNGALESVIDKAPTVIEAEG